jgi:prophage maintenance system killer protein
MTKQLIIYQSKQGEIAFKGDPSKETLWASQAQIADLFGVDRSVVTKHIKNIFSDKELNEKVVSAKFAQATPHGAMKGKTQTRDVVFYNLDIILAVGYRTKSSVAVNFRQWATKTLREHIVKGYTINKKRLAKNYDEFLRAVDVVKKLLPSGGQVKAEDALELIKMFADTWFSLDAYDKLALPKSGANKRQAKITADELVQAIAELKQDLLRKKEATNFFAQERSKDSVAGIYGNIFQSAFGRDVYSTLEEKAAHLLYFIIKNHPFVDGNKRSGAFSFVWFLNKSGLLRKDKLTPEALTALSLLVAESKPAQKEQMIGLVLQLLKK